MLVIVIDEESGHLVSIGCLVRLAEGSRVEADVCSLELRTGGLAELLQYLRALGCEIVNVWHRYDDARLLLLGFLLRLERLLIVARGIPLMTSFAQVVVLHGPCGHSSIILIAALS